MNQERINKLIAMKISGKKLKEALNRKGMTQSALASEVGVAPPSITNWIKNGVPGYRVEEVARALDLHDRNRKMKISGKKLRKALNRKGMTQSALASEVDVTPPAVTFWINNGVPDYRVEEVARALELHDQNRKSDDTGEDDEEEEKSDPIGRLDEHKIPLDDEVKEHLDGKSGVYFLVGRDGRPLYIGMSKNIKSRVEQHQQKSSWFEQGVKELRYIEINDDGLRKALEPMLIYLFNPPFNIHHVPD